jgi:hypothetical protein
LEIPPKQINKREFTNPRSFPKNRKLPNIGSNQSWVVLDFYEEPLIPI